MRKLLHTSVNALQIASSLSGVPFVGAAALIVQDIVQACDDIRVQKVLAH